MEQSTCDRAPALLANHSTVSRSSYPSPVHRQRGRLTEGTGLSFAIADATSNNAVGAIGLWLQNLSAGRATAGYSSPPCTAWSYTSSHPIKAQSALQKCLGTSEKTCSPAIKNSATLDVIWRSTQQSAGLFLELKRVLEVTA